MRYRQFSNEKGSAMAMVILIMLILSVLGTAILSLASSENTFTRNDSMGQSAYYVAESGVHYIQNEIKEKIASVYGKLSSKDDFFIAFETDYKDKNFTFDSFEKNQGEQPRADIRVERVSSAENSRDYRIQSVGSIGKSKRTVSTVITLTWAAESGGPADMLFKTLKFIFNGSNFNVPPNKTIVISGQDSGTLNGDSRINVKNIYFKELKNGVISGRTYGDQNDPGDIYLDGNAKILDSGRIMYGNVHAKGDFTVTGGVDIYGDLFVGGEFQVKGGSVIYGDLYVGKDLKINGGAEIKGNVYVFGDIEAGGGGKIRKNLYVEGDATLNSITIDGDAYINGTLQAESGGSIGKNLVVGGSVTMRGFTVNGNADINGPLDATGGGKIYGNATINGSSKIVNYTFGGVVKIKGNLNLDWTPTFNNKVYYSGTLKTPDNFSSDVLSKCVKDTNINIVINKYPMEKPDFSFVVPECTASLKDDAWYTAHGYEKKGHVTSKLKKDAVWLVDSYKNTDWQEIKGKIIIVSKGDIILRGEDEFFGALIAPNGTVKYTGGNFKGIIISNKEISLSGWGPAEIYDIVEFFGAGNVPVNFSCSGGDGSGGGTTSKILLTVKQGIKEK